MRITIGPRPEVTVRPEIRARRPPDEYVSLLMKNESEFRRYIRDVESDPAFKRLLSEGCVKKVYFKGRIPHHLYQEFRDKEFMEFLKKYNITSKADWESDFFDKNARRKVNALATKYKAPRGELIKSLEYCRHLRLSWDGHEEGWEPPRTRGLDDPDRFIQPEAPQISVQSDESLEVLQELIEQYSISEEEFMEHFLSGNKELFEIARELEMDVNAVEDILEALEKVHILSSMQVNVVEHEVQGFQVPDLQPIALVQRFRNPPRAEIQIDAKEQYGFRYDINEREANISRDESALIDKLKMINQRRTLTFRIISFIYEHQYPYLVSGNELYLRPLSQAQIAKEVGEHESTVSRILRNRSIETSEGALPLRFFCQSKKEVISRIIQIREHAELASCVRSEPFSDAEIADILEKEYNTKVSRRTVTYYRNKIKGTPKFYVRRKKV